MTSGMGMPSMGIYSYELYNFFGVENIIRIGSCGGYTKDLHIFDTALIEKSYTEGNFALAFNNEEKHIESADTNLNDLICSEIFDWYATDKEQFKARIPKEYNITCAEMEAFALFYTAKVLKKKAACLLTVVDSQVYEEQATSEQREKSLDDMIKLALESAINI